MPKNLVLCSDGTGMQFGPRNSNVVKLYSVLEHDPDTQVIYYDPGVGTFSVHPALTRIARGILRGFGLAFGLGITANILDAYRFIMQNYEDGDRIYMFGFSRGAYTVRGVAALIHKCGLLHPHNDNLIPFASRVFKREKRPEIYFGFRKTFARKVRVHFLGLWDTVSSVGWIYDPVTLPFTTNNPSVDVVRHAISIDERRAFFRQNLWRGPGAAEKESLEQGVEPVSAGGRAQQDVKQVWFAGVHSDVGGGYAEEESGLSKLALEWMLVEAVRSGMRIDLERAEGVVEAPAAPDPDGMAHNSLTPAWLICEIWPKLYRDPRDGFRRKPRFNLARRRFIAENSVVHQTVRERAEYRPPNLPETTRVEPRVRLSSLVK